MASSKVVLPPPFIPPNRMMGFAWPEGVRVRGCRPAYTPKSLKTTESRIIALSLKRVALPPPTQVVVHRRQSHACPRLLSFAPRRIGAPYLTRRSHRRKSDD